MKHKSIFEALVIRGFSILSSAVFFIYGLSIVGEVSYGQFAISLLSTGVFASLGSAGLGRAALRNARVPNFEAVSFLRKNINLLISTLLFSGFFHFILILLLESASSFSPPNRVMFAAIGAAHTILAAFSIVVSDLLRSDDRHIPADLTHGRIGGSISSICALIILVICKYMYIEINSFILVCCYVAGNAISLTWSLKTLIEYRTSWFEAALNYRTPILDSSESAALSVGLAVAPLIAAVPAWLASFVLAQADVGVLGLATQFAGVLGAVGFAIQSRFVADLGLTSSHEIGKEQELLGNIQDMHNKAAPILGVGVFGAYLSLIFGFIIFGYLFDYSSSGTLLLFFVFLGFVQVWNASMGMTGIQLQLSGRSMTMVWIDLARVFCLVVFVFLFGNSNLTFLIAVTLPGLLWPWVMAKVVTNLLGIRTSAFRQNIYDQYKVSDDKVEIL